MSVKGFPNLAWLLIERKSNLSTDRIAKSRWREIQTQKTLTGTCLFIQRGSIENCKLPFEKRLELAILFGGNLSAETFGGIGYLF